jgi:ABC-type polysaccharide/polyol phosphate export permease
LLESAKKFDAPWHAISVAVAAVLPASGLWYFRKTERQFADVI